METLGILYGGSPRNGRQAIEEVAEWMKKHCEKPPRIVAPVWTDNLLERAASVMTTDAVLVMNGSRPADAALKHRGAADKPILVFAAVAPRIRDKIRTLKNATGVCAHTSDHDAARLDLLLGALGYNNLPTIGVLRNSNRGDTVDQWTAIQGAASGKCKLVDADINSGLTIKKVFEEVFPHGGVDAVLVAADHFFYHNRTELVDKANKFGHLAIYQWSEFVNPPLGGYMSYGPNRQACIDRAKAMLKTINQGGAVPPVYDVPEGEFELVVNQARAVQLNRWPLPAALEKYRPTVV